MKRDSMKTPGLSSWITGAPRTQTQPTAGSSTQRRKRALASYTPIERRNGRPKP